MIEAIKVNQPNFLSFENIFRFHTSMIEPSLGKGEEQRYWQRDAHILES